MAKSVLLLGTNWQHNMFSLDIWWEHEGPYGIHLGTSKGRIKKKKKIGLLGHTWHHLIGWEVFLVVLVTIFGLSQWQGHELFGHIIVYLSQPHFGAKCENATHTPKSGKMQLTLPKVGKWSPPRLPKI
jgi:hypothetical protein